MQKFEDEKQLDQFLKSFQKEISKDDEFLKTSLKGNLDIYEKLKEKEKKIDEILVKKRSDIQENLRFLSETIETSLKIFFEFEVIKIEDNNYINIKIFGKFLTNNKIDNYFRNEEKEKKTNFAKNRIHPRYSFFKMLKRVEIIPENEEEIEKPLKLDIRSIKKTKNRKGLENLKGFSIKRLINKSEVYPLNIKIKFSLQNYSKVYKLISPLKEFMNNDFATRKQIFEKLWDYIKEKKLLEKNTILLDNELLKLFTPDGEEKKIDVSELGIQIKDLLGGEEVSEFEFEILNDEKFVKSFEKKIILPLDEAKECMAFFAEKLLFDENEKKKIMNGEKKELNNFITVNEKNKISQKEILKDFEKFYKLIIKRENYKKFKNDIPTFLQNFINKQNQNMKILKSNSSSILRKRNWHDENDFVDNLLNNYENVMDREIKRFLKPKNE